MTATKISLHLMLLLMASMIAINTNRAAATAGEVTLQPPPAPIDDDRAPTADAPEVRRDGPRARAGDADWPPRARGAQGRWRDRDAEDRPAPPRRMRGEIIAAVEDVVGELTPDEKQQLERRLSDVFEEMRPRHGMMGSRGFGPRDGRGWGGRRGPGVFGPPDDRPQGDAPPKATPRRSFGRDDVGRDAPPPQDRPRAGRGRQPDRQQPDTQAWPREGRGRFRQDAPPRRGEGQGRIERFFERFDRNNDGVIDREEMRQGMQQRMEQRRSPRNPEV